MPDGPAAFLAERLDEAERNAGEIHARDCQAMSPMVIWGSPSQGCGPCNCGQPERELRAIAAKRAILDAYVRTDGGSPRDRDRGRWDAMHATIRRLAAEWDEHPAYQPGWSAEPAAAP